ncbi:DUF4136 domain-containing protein [Marinobacter bryozoorum]|uniref:DUF4136 domain-containing protein n=1 Tax=Marinobacter bryozoorum TaxID=256324 RepID=UPI002006ACD2|nr:DUF4136 domain-containing protein [Marinobacter bryozoorum]MCK7543698.1 DUF4136 domain-containing protein [Marinobacter bryozoorum]
MIRPARIPHVLALLAVVLLLGGCAAKVVTDYDRNAAFASYQTWAFAPNAGEGYTTLDGARVEAAVVRELEARQLDQVGFDVADLLVSYRIDEVERLDTTGFSYGLGFGRGRFGWGLSTAPPVREVREGQLIVELVDSSTERVVWRGASKRYLNENQSPGTRQELIDEVVAEMFNRYPPQSDTQSGN